MNVETEIRELLRSKADELDGGATIPLVTVARVRRRRIATAAGTALFTIAVVAGAVAGISSLRRDSTRPVPFEINPTLRGNIKVDGHPIDIVAGLGGVWAQTEKGIVHIDPVINVPVKTIDLRVKGKQYYSYPRTLALGDGAVWVIAADNKEQTFLVGSPIGGRVTSRSFSCTASSISNPSPAPCTEGPLEIQTLEASAQPRPQSTGSQRFGFTPEPARPASDATQTWVVLRIDPRSDDVTLVASVSGLHPSGAAVGGGAVWVASAGDGNGAAYRIDGRTGGVDEFPVGTGYAVAMAADNALAAAAFTGPPDPGVTIFDSRSDRIISQAGVGLEDEVRDVIVAGGRAWVLLNGHGSKRNETVVAPIHPASNGPADTIAVPENARGMVIDQGILWVSADSSGHVYWFNPIDLKMLGQIEVPQQKPTGPKPPPVSLIGSFAVGENGLWITGIGDTDTVTVYSLTR